MFFGHILKLNPYPIFRTKKRLKNWGVKKIFSLKLINLNYLKVWFLKYKKKKPIGFY
jgi:hypothetical protein